MGKTISFEIGWADKESPPDNLVSNVVMKVRLWLHEQGLEGGLRKIQRNDREVDSLIIMRPDDWSDSDVKNFCNAASEYIKTVANH